MSKYFTKQELACQHCGEVGFKDENLELLDKIRESCGFPFIVTSGYRCSAHPIEKQKASPGEHASGDAVDIACRGADALKLIYVAQNYGIKRIGVAQKGSSRFIHIGFDLTRPDAIWSY